jgi:hypothetical protein
MEKRGKRKEDFLREKHKPIALPVISLFCLSLFSFLH